MASAVRPAPTALPRDDARPAKPRGEWTDKPRGDYADKPRKAGGWKRDGEGDARSANARPYAKREGGNDKPRGEKAYGEKSFGDKRPKPKGEWQDAPARKSAAGDRPRFNDGEAAMRREDDRAWKTNESASDRPARKLPKSLLTRATRPMATAASSPAPSCRPCRR